MSGTELFATFLGSVALLLWGVRMVRTGMTRAFGAALRRVDRDLRAHARSSAFFAGIGVTGILQSSTATALAARLVRGARPDRAAARARRHARRRCRLGDRRAGLLAST